MAFVVLFSTMSFTIDMHYCGDTLVDTSIFTKAKTCGMEMQKPKAISDCSIMKKNCCTEEQIIIEGQDELKISFNELSFRPTTFRCFVCVFLYQPPLKIWSKTKFMQRIPSTSYSQDHIQA